MLRLPVVEVDAVLGERFPGPGAVEDVLGDRGQVESGPAGVDPGRIGDGPEADRAGVGAEVLGAVLLAAVVVHVDAVLEIGEVAFGTRSGGHRGPQ